MFHGQHLQLKHDVWSFRMYRLHLEKFFFRIWKFCFGELLEHLILCSVATFQRILSHTLLKTDYFREHARAQKQAFDLRPFTAS